MVRINRVYTRTGDDGHTHLAGGQRVAKDSERIASYGTIDELSATIGLVRAESRRGGEEELYAELDARLQRIQNELFNLGAQLATLTQDLRPDTPRIEDRHVKRLEDEIDAMNEPLDALESFVLPGGGPVVAHLHLARTVARRAERIVIQLGRSEKLPNNAVRYLNRLSDFLFVASRWMAHQAGESEVLWRPETV